MKEPIQFKVDDIVKVLEYYIYHDMRGLVGVVKIIKDNMIGVEFAESNEFVVIGHDCGGYTHEDRGWWFTPDKLALYNPILDSKYIEF